MHPAVTVLAVAVPAVVPMKAHGQLGDVRLDAVEVADSQAYLVYRYALRNPPESTWSVSSVSLDIRASSGTPENLPTTGILFDITRSGGAPVEPHAEVGPIAPPPWETILSRRAGLTWAPPNSRSATVDSVAPGVTMTGFGIRSSYLPGVSIVVVAPLSGDCCLVPADTSDEPFYASPRDFAQTTRTVVPRYMPEEVDLRLVTQLLDESCLDAVWIDSTEVCDRLRLMLAEPERLLTIGDITACIAALRAFIGAVGGAAADGDIDRQLYLLLAPNARHVVGRLGGSGALGVR